ncbi:MAG: hypothetical protein Q8R07_00025, partial [Candidatus Uhrbacteria bacterium]|nr:hypothetical protein [Candidatus Uhrbacteria bacterium]
MSAFIFLPMPKTPLHSPRKKSIKPKRERKSVTVSKKPIRIRKKKMTAPSLMLENQLALVIEQPGMTISVARRQRINKSRSKKNIDAVMVIGDRIQSFDHALAERAGQGIKGRAGTRVPIRYDSHEASQHLLSLKGLIGSMESPAPEFEGPSIRDWVAPYDIPPSLEDLVAHTKDLYLDRVDPRLFLDQFTPHDADVAFAERYGWWSRLRAPFIRWEQVETQVTGHRLQVTDSKPQPSTFHDQFTPSDADRAFYEVYGWTAR